MLTARSSFEAHLYMDLHRCAECGSGDFDRQHRLEQHGDDFVAVYEGACRQCGNLRRFEFRMAEEIPPPPPAFGGPEPSQIIDPGEFLDVAFRISEATGLQLLNSPESEHHKLRGSMVYCVAAFEEVLKFIPSGQDAVPVDAFTSEAGLDRYRQDPGKFSRRLIDIYLKNARAVLADIDQVSSPDIRP
ncbi:hypothetical protein [Streptomyces sp. NPDC058579]|uniref:hypothetical protein n=1 Tax=Streptomyces sp. NPDC058579 TaxID=3346548 RepID=UPI003653D141